MEDDESSDSALAPVAVLDGVALARLLHQLRVQRLVALPAAPVDLHSIKVKVVQRGNVAGVILEHLGALAALAAVEVPASDEAERVHVCHHGLCVGERLGVNRRTPVRSMLRVVYAGAAALPALVDANRAVTNVAEREFASASSGTAVLAARSSIIMFWVMRLP